jgi:tetratricopeptide (TPR) repeat protein
MLKRFFCTITLFCNVSLNLLFAQNAQIIEKQVLLPTYSFSDPDPVPAPGKTYPYFRFDGFTDKSEMQNWKMIEMENDYIKLWVTPEIGGKIWGAIEKSTGREFIYYNHAVKFRDVAMRGPWTSGGIEINFGVIGHAPTCSSPVDYMIRNNSDGSVSCFVGAIDLSSRTRWSVEINLPKDKAYFTTRSVWDNPTATEQSYYHWMNLGVKTAGNLEYSFPGNYHLGHDGNYFSWPVDEQGREINFYEKNNFGSYKSYHVFGEPSGFYGAYWHDDDFGFAHHSTYDEKPGKKVWIWGLSDEGMIWEKLLTDSDGQYTEIQSGRLFNQAAESSSKTPFKNRGFAPGSTDEFTEHWFPVKETKGLKNATPAGSVNLEQNNNKVSVWFCPNEITDGIFEIRNEDETIFSREIHLTPMQTISETFEFNGSTQNLSVWLNNRLLFDANREKNTIKRPVESPSDFNWETAYGYYLSGKEKERQRLYKTAGDDYQKALEKEPWFLPALTGMAHLSYRETNYQTAFEYALKALSVDTYDSEANMAYGLAGLALGDTVSAIDGFSVASSGISLRSAAYNSLANIFMNKTDYSRALGYAEKSLVSNQSGSEAVQLKILSLRKLNRLKDAENELSLLELKDPLNHFIRIERYFTNPHSDNKLLVQKNVTNELAHETYLEYAIWYFKNGQLADALKVLELAPENQPVVLLWEAYLHHIAEKEQTAAELLNMALQLSPELVFPFRTETLKPLEWAQTKSDNWKLKYYAGLIYLNAGNEEKAKQLWNSCGNTSDFYPFYIARYETADAESTQAQADIEKALSLPETDWRAGFVAAKYHLAKNDLVKSEELSRDFYKKYPENYTLGLHYAKVLEMNEKNSECVNMLQKINVLPNEGATEGRRIWRNANIGMALDFMKEKNYKKALQSIEKARQWPENLGVGKPYDVDERIEDFIAMECYKKLKDKSSAGKMQLKITGNPVNQDLSFDSTDLLKAWLLKESGNKSGGDQVINMMQSKNPASKIVQWCSAVYSGLTEQAGVIEKEIDHKDRTFHILKRINNEIFTETESSGKK